MAESTGTPVPPTRRAVFAAAGGVGLAAALTACGSDSASDSSSGTPSGATGTGTPSAPATSTDTGSGPSASAGAGGTPLGKTSDIPVGGGKIFADQKVVVTQPAAGQFKGFSATCTHMGCLVTSVSNGTINCPCHGSKFHVADGSVAHGPATAPLPAKQVTVSGDSVNLG